MVKLFDSKQTNFKTDLLKFLETNNEFASNIVQSAKQILQDIKENGDSALIKYTNQYDNVNYQASDLVISEEEINNAYSQVDEKTKNALLVAAKRIEAYHKKQMPEDFDYVDEIGVRLGNLWRPLDSAGLYVPGGLASYPSSVLMNAIPAKVAGVKRIAMTVPTPNGVINNIVLAAAKIANVSEIYKVGGAQAIGAFAHGTKTIKKVCKIVGPGNAYVAAAKREVFGIVGIDMVAGPSEILIIADKDNQPKWLAADLMSQAEHDENARSILITTSKELAQGVEQEVNKLLETLQRKDIAAKSWQNNGAIITVENLEQATEIANIIAAEHLELCVENPDELISKINNAGAIFAGKYTPEAIGDYTAGPSHVLPTAGTASYSSGLSVYDFLKRISLISCSTDSFEKLAKDTEHLANEEGLEAHALSCKVRYD